MTGILCVTLRRPRLGFARLIVATALLHFVGLGCNDQGQNQAASDATLRNSGELGSSDLSALDLTANDDAPAADLETDLVFDDSVLGEVSVDTTLDSWQPPLDAVEDTATAPECVTNTDCGSGRGCLAGICRDECFLGLVCGTTYLGELCQDGLCVQCKADSDCTARQRCDVQTFTCSERTIDPSLTKFGIFYHTWHCRAANSTPVHDLSEVQAGRQSYDANFQTFYWWDEPEAGYYCLSQNDALLRVHAEAIRDAGIDFVFLDVTNHAFVGAGSDDTPGMILQPLDRLLAVWSTVTNAPKVVAWVPVESAGIDPSRYTVDAINARMAAYPQMSFIYRGKPLLLVTVNDWHPVNAARVAQLANDFTVRVMWAHIDKHPAGTYSPEAWSFLETCQNTPTANSTCNQRVSMFDGAPEQVTVTTAYQFDYMSVPGAVGKQQGLTFRKQFETAFAHPEVPIVTITGWNEWIAQRQPCGIASCDCATYPQGCFLDAWDLEHNRDIEPARNAMGDYYYRLLTACVGLYKQGASCDTAHSDNLCCKSFTP